MQLVKTKQTRLIPFFLRKQMNYILVLMDVREKFSKSNFKLIINFTLKEG